MNWTSRAARDTIDASALENLVYEAIFSFGLRGCISDQLRHMFPHLAYSSVTARFANLVESGRVYRPGFSRQGDSGRDQMVMWADKFRDRLHVVADPDGEIRKRIEAIAANDAGGAARRA